MTETRATFHKSENLDLAQDEALEIFRGEIFWVASNKDLPVGGSSEGTTETPQIDSDAQKFASR